MADRIYTVVRGDTLYGIARRFGLTVEQLKSMNALRSDSLYVGQPLRVGVTNTPAPTPPRPAPSPTTTTTPASGSKMTSTYQVVRGDTLYAIARRFAMTIDQLVSMNNLGSTALSVGQTLRVLIDVPNTPPSRPNNPPTWPTPPSNVPAQPPTNPPSNNTPTPVVDVHTARRLFALEVRPENGFNRYLLTVPLLDGRTIVANMRDNVTMSRFMVYPYGLLYPGQSHVELDLRTIQSVGLTEAQARALQYVSTHEGSFDAINTYDAGIFSYGFIQFVGASAHGASLNRVLASMKANAPDRFALVFQRVGINIEGGSLTVLNDTGGKLWNDDAWQYIQRTVRLYAAFIQAGFEPVLVREQLRMANTLYIQQALNFKLFLNFGGFTINIPRLGDLLRSEAMLTAVFALAISRGVGGMSQIVSASVSNVANARNIANQDELYRLDERLIADDIARTATDERVRNRVNGVLASNLSFAKV